MQTRNLAVAGAGNWGVNLVRNFAALGALKTVFDIDPERAAAAAARWGAQPAASYDEVLEDPAIEAVAIATPAETHYGLARRALRVGRDVFVEKPITLRPAQCEELIELAERGERILMVGHLLKYHPAVLKLKELVEQGRLGRLQYLYSNRLNLGRVRREENALWSFAPHDLSVILYLLGGELPLQVSAAGGTYLQPNIADVTVSQLLFAGGVRAHVFVSWLHPFKEQKLVAIGSAAMACFDDLAPEKLRLFDQPIEVRNGAFVTGRPAGTPVAIGTAEPLAEECAHFLGCIARRETPRTDGRDGLAVLTVLQACQRSLELNGEPVQIDAAALLRPALA